MAAAAAATTRQGAVVSVPDMSAVRMVLMMRM